MAEDFLPKVATPATSPVLDKLEKKISGQGAIATSRAGAVRAGKGPALFISNEGMDDIIKIIESLGKSGLLTDGATETVKHEIKNQEGAFFLAMMAPMAASLIARISSL